MSHYDSFLTLRGIRRVKGDLVGRAFPVTVEILFSIFHHFDFNSFHACMHAAFLVAVFSFLRISNLVPYKLSDVSSLQSYFLKRKNLIFTDTGITLKVHRTKTIQFKQKALEIPLPCISGSVLCPVAAVQNYLRLAPVAANLPMFQYRENDSLKLILLGDTRQLFVSV